MGILFSLNWHGNLRSKKMFIKANTLQTQTQIKLHKTNNYYLKFKCNNLIWGKFPMHLYSCNMARVTTEQYCSLPSPVITEGQTTSTMHTFTVDHPTTLQYTFTSSESWTSYFTTICHIFRYVYACIHFTKRLFLAVKSIFWYKMDGLMCTD
jgi:hypothetical protein